MEAGSKHRLEMLPPLIVKSMHLALQRMEMYGEEHAVAQQAIKASLKLIRELFDHTPSFTISKVNEQILFDKTPLEESYFTRRFSQDFDELGIHSITFHRRMTDTEFVAFLKFLVRVPGKKRDEQNIEEYLNELGITSIEVDRIKYVAVMGEVDEEEEARKVLTDIIARHPEIIERLLGDAREELAPVVDMTFGMLPLDASEIDVVELLSAIVKERGLLEKDEEEMSEVDRQLMKLVETIRENLSEEAKKRFLEKLEEITDRMVIEPDATTRLLEEEFTLKEVSLIDTIDDLLQDALQSGWNAQVRYQLRQAIERFLASGDPQKAFLLVEKLLSFYDKTGALWTVEVIKEVIEAAFEREDDVLTLALLGDLLQQKGEAKPDAPRFTLLTAALLFFASLLLLSQKYSAVLRIIKEYEERITSEPTFQVLSDAETFFTGLSSQENISKLLSTLGDKISALDVQLRGILEKLDGETLADVVIDELGSRRTSFVRVAASVLETHKPAAFRKIEEYMRSLPRLQRSDMGYIINAEQLRRTINVLSLALYLDKERALPLLILATADKDPRIAKHVFFLLMLYHPKRVQEIIETVFLEMNKELREEVVESIAQKPNPVKDFYLREIILHFPDLREEIIRTLGNAKTEYAKNLLLDILSQWVVYIDPLPEARFKRLLIRLVRSLEPFADEPEVRKALKHFRLEWKTEGIVKESFSIFSRKKDEVLEAIDKVLHK